MPTAGPKVRDPLLLVFLEHSDEPRHLDLDRIKVSHTQQLIVVRLRPVRLDPVTVLNADELPLRVALRHARSSHGLEVLQTIELNQRPMARQMEVEAKRLLMPARGMAPLLIEQHSELIKNSSNLLLTF